MSTFRKAITGVRYSGGSRVNGTWVPGTTAPLNIRGSIQPVSGEELENTPLLQRQKGSVYRVYSDDVLFTIKDNEQADELNILGKDHIVIEKQLWRNDVINHYKYFVSEILPK